MSQVIYVDVLIIINLLVNYFLLLSSCAIIHIYPKRIRMFLASVVGAFYSLIIFLPELNMFFSMLLRILCLSAMILIAFKISNIKIFLKLCASFFMSNFIFAGIMLAIWVFLEPDGMVYKNGAVYFDINAVILTLSAVVCYIIVCTISLVLKRRAPDSHIVKLTIRNNGVTVCGTALFDTGNTLQEPFSSFPVIICERNFVEKILPQWFYSSEKDDRFTELSKEIRFISYKSVGGEGLLPAFKPDFAIVEDNGRKAEVNTVYIAVYSKTLSGGEYNALVGNLFFEMFEKGVKSNGENLKVGSKNITSYKK